jgi:hypothetical protein
MLNIDRICALYKNSLPTPQAQAGFAGLLAFLEADDAITDLRWAAYMLATVKWECAGTWQPMEEIGKGAGKPYGVPVTIVGDDGVTYTNVYYGRGDVQLTWRANYARMSQALGLGTLLLLHPEHALEPQTAHSILSLGMRQGMFTGVGLGRFIHDGVCDYVNARKIINGLDQAAKIAQLAGEFEKLLSSNLVAPQNSSATNSPSPVS